MLFRSRIMGKKGQLSWVVDRWVNLNKFSEYQEPNVNGCIEWTGVKSNIGYGFIGFRYPEGQTSPSGHKAGMMTVRMQNRWFLFEHCQYLGTLFIQRFAYNSKKTIGSRFGNQRQDVVQGSP